MNRLRKFYENRFQSLAEKFGDSSANFSSQLFLRATELSEREKIHCNLALAMVHADIRNAAGETKNFPEKFFCDAGLGGLARWLRAAGYESAWNPDLNDAAVIREAKQFAATLVTSDTLMMERGVLRDGLQPAICVPSSLTCEEQLTVVFREMNLELREPRCMSCGGELRRVPKETIASRIPPRTARWLDEYFLCANCDRLFWHGTHWQRIARELRGIASASNRSAVHFR